MEDPKNGVELTEKKGSQNGTLQKETSSEKAILLEYTRRVSLATAVKLRYAAIAVSWISVILAFCLGITATVFAWMNDSQSLFSFGLDSLLDCISSVVVLWRFYGNGSTLYSEERERRACLIIGVLFIFSFVSIAAKSTYALVMKEHILELTVTLILCIINGVCCIILGFSKIFIGRKLESPSLMTDSVITLTGAVMSIFTLITLAVYRDYPSLWYLDDVFGLVCSVFLFSYGTWVLCRVVRGRQDSPEKM